MDFWDAFWLLLIFIPLLLVWGFAIVDIFRRDDISGWLKALWIVVVVVMPFLGTLIYLVFRQPGGTPQERSAMDEASREFVQKYTPTDTSQRLAVLADLHDRGKLTDDEFAHEKSRVVEDADEESSGRHAAARRAGSTAAPTGQGGDRSTTTSA
jgi:hypothetical protein